MFNFYPVLVTGMSSFLCCVLLHLSAILEKFYHWLYMPWKYPYLFLTGLLTILKVSTIAIQAYRITVRLTSLVYVSFIKKEKTNYNRHLDLKVTFNLYGMAGNKFPIFCLTFLNTKPQTQGLEQKLEKSWLQ